MIHEEAASAPGLDVCDPAAVGTIVSRRPPTRWTGETQAVVCFPSSRGSAYRHGMGSAARIEHNRTPANGQVGVGATGVPGERVGVVIEHNLSRGDGLGVTAGTRRETTWVTRDMGRVFPAEWEELVAMVPEAEQHGDLAAAYARLLANPDGVREEAARRWCAWEDAHVSLTPGWTAWPRYDDPTFRSVFARLVTHYWSNDCFLADDELVRNMDRIAHVPGILVHGRCDISSPLETAWTLHKRWPASRLAIVGHAGHGGEDFDAALVSAIDEMRDRDGYRPPPPHR